MTHSDKAALRGEPSYIWRSGQDRRLRMIQEWISLEESVILDNGCGLGTYLDHFSQFSSQGFGLEIEHDRAVKVWERACVQSTREAPGQLGHPSADRLGSD